MVGLHIVLRNFAFIDLVLFRQEVYSKRLLKQRITPVFFVPQYSEFDTKPQGVAFGNKNAQPVACSRRARYLLGCYYVW